MITIHALEGFLVSSAREGRLPSTPSNLDFFACHPQCSIAAEQICTIHRFYSRHTTCRKNQLPAQNVLPSSTPMATQSKPSASRETKIPMRPRGLCRLTCTLARIGVNGSKSKTLTVHLVTLGGYLVRSGKACPRKTKNHMKIWLQ